MRKGVCYKIFPVFCEECGIKLCYRAFERGTKLCRSCSRKGERNHNWNTDRTKKTYSNCLSIRISAKKASKKYRLNHLKAVKERKRKYSETHRDMINERQRRWYYAKPNKKLSNRAYTFSRKSGGLLTKETLQIVYEDNIKRFGTLTCYLCLQPIEFGKDHLEHKIPLSRGGTNARDNLDVACSKCNLSKNRKTETEFRNGVINCAESS